MLFKINFCYKRKKIFIFQKQQHVRYLFYSMHISTLKLVSISIKSMRPRRSTCMYIGSRMEKNVIAKDGVFYIFS